MPINNVTPLNIPMNYLKAVFCLEYSQTLSSVGKNIESMRLLKQSKRLFESVNKLTENEEYIKIKIYKIRKNKKNYLELIHSLEKSIPQKDNYKMKESETENEQVFISLIYIYRCYKIV